ENVVVLEHGKPLIFGKEKDKAVILDGFEPKVVNLKEENIDEKDLWIHDVYDENPIRAFILAHLQEHPGLPTPIGIFRSIERPTYDEEVTRQIEEVQKKKGKGDLERLLFSANTWEVK
ncbi:MAG: 2-oxoacid:ferredoxin oxidoreductase subunit beta, partial [Ignavibacteria bacterium]